MYVLVITLICISGRYLLQHHTGRICTKIKHAYRYKDFSVIKKEKKDLHDPATIANVHTSYIPVPYYIPASSTTTSIHITLHQVINCYLECYAHTYDKRERHRLAKTITTYLHCRPRYDAEASYFTPAYEAEVKCLKSECQLVQEMINYQLMEERTYNQQTCSFGEKIFFL